ncbi:MAG: thiamine pyrophosphate-binding protein, partial [Chloroflexota bacterium]
SGSSPVLALSSQIPSSLLGRGKGALHEAGDQVAVMRALIGDADRVQSVAEIPSALRATIRRMRAGRPRPAYMEFCTDLLAARGEVEVPTPMALPRPAGNPAAIRQAAEMLRSARRPIIWAGAGAFDAGAQLQTLAETLRAPVLTSIFGKGAISEDHPLSLGSRTREGPVIEMLRASDLAIAVGTRFTWLPTNEWKVPVPANLIQVDADPTQIGKNYPAKLGIVGDARLVLQQILDELAGDANGHERDLAAVAAEVRSVKEHIDEKLRADGASPELDVIAGIAAALARDAIVVCDLTMPAYWARVHLPVYTPRSFFAPSNFGGLGFALPAAIGTKVAWPRRQVVCMSGDGGFQFTGQELATAAQYGLNVVVLLFNDQGYGVLRHEQDTRFGGRRNQVDIVNPDFVRLAEAYGVSAWRVGASELRPAMEEALAGEKPALIEVQASLRRVWTA